MIRVPVLRSAVVAAAVIAVLVSTAQVASAWRKGSGLPRQYEALLESADNLWSQYKQADSRYFDEGRTDTRSHVTRLAEIQNQLAGLHTTWMQTEAPDGLEVVDLKVGLALELQMAAIGAELVALLNEDQSYLELSAELDAEYEVVVNDL